MPSDDTPTDTPADRPAADEPAADKPDAKQAYDKSEEGKALRQIRDTLCQLMYERDINIGLGVVGKIPKLNKVPAKFTWKPGNEKWKRAYELQEIVADRLRSDRNVRERFKEAKPVWNVDAKDKNAARIEAFDTYCDALAYVSNGSTFDEIYPEYIKITDSDTSALDQQLAGQSIDLSLTTVFGLRDMFGHIFQKRLAIMEKTRGPLKVEEEPTPVRQTPTASSSRTKKRTTKKRKATLSPATLAQLAMPASDDNKEDSVKHETVSDGEDLLSAEDLLSVEEL